MVRAGVVSHPSGWEWVGYHEIMGQRKRGGLLDLERVQKNLEASLAEALAREQVRRETCWSESLAVGSPDFVKRMQPLILSRQETEIAQGQEGVWALGEAAAPYGQKAGPKS